MSTTEYQQSLDAIARRRAIAEQLSQGAMQYGGTQMSGTGRHPIAVQTSPAEVMGKLAQAYLAKKQLSKLDTEKNEIAKAMASDRTKALEGLIPKDTAPSYERNPLEDENQGPTRMTPVPRARGKTSPQAMQAAIDAGIDPSVIAAAGKGPERFKLSPGEIVKDETGAVVVDGGPAADKQDNTLEVVIGADGKRRYVKRADAVGQEAPQNAGVQVNVGDKLPTPPQGMAYVKDPSSQFGYRLEKIPGARDQRTESQQKAGLLAKRMQELSGDVQNEAPSITSQQLATYAQEGGVTGAMSNKMLKEKDQKHFNAARGWLSGILRQDTGATISKEEFQQYYPTYFPVPGDTAPVIEQKRKLRAVTEAGLAQIGGQEQQAPQAPSGDIQTRVDSYYGN